jgi:hypothetical protein
VPGITSGCGLEETVRLITEARDAMNRRLAALSDGTTAAYPHILLAVDDYSYLTAALGPLTRGPAVSALAEIAASGRAARITLLVVAHILYGFPAWLPDLFGTRIVLGPASAAAALRLLGDETACRGVPGSPGNGTAVTGGRPPAAVCVLPPRGSRQPSILPGA